ncbi:MAG: phytanoyl-CoA dioxygenase family protein [Candidatus Hydrogenedentes bacterium]|nr:phytanoyl-CoA dioxygenase family protein [Candidatus Hydrogenedentota bacterium]
MKSVSDGRERYSEDGFYIWDQPLIPAAVVSQAIAGMDAVRTGVYDTGVPPQPSYWNPGDSPKKLCKIEMPQIANRAVMELVSHPALGELAAAVTGAKMVQVWWVQLLCKPPADPDGAEKTDVGWHQDRQYWQIWEEGSELFTAWVALTNVTAEAGPMRFIRGSHRWGFLNQGDFYGQNLETQRHGIQAPPGTVWDEVPALLPPGGASFHHCLTFHGSGPNHTTEFRRSFAIHMRTENSAPVHGERKGLTQFIDRPDYCPITYHKSV